MRRPASSRGRVAAAWIGLAVLAILPFLPLGSSSDSPLSRALFDAGHLPWMAATTTAAFLALRRLGAAPRLRAALAGSAGAGIALTVELIQPLIGRTASPRDLGAGLLGVALAVGGILVWARGAGRPGRALHALCAAAALTLVCWPAWTEARTLLWRARNFPLLADFEHGPESGLWRGQGAAALRGGLSVSDQRATRGTHSLRLHVPRGKYGGVVYRAGEQDWSPFGQLVLDVFRQGPPVRLHVRIDDAADSSEDAQRYHRGWWLQPGSNEIRIPIDEIRRGPVGRELDMHRIARMILFVPRKQQAAELFFDHIRLESAP